MASATCTDATLDSHLTRLRVTVPYGVDPPSETPRGMRPKEPLMRKAVLPISLTTLLLIIIILLLVL